jgi:hypothetical protein
MPQTSQITANCNQLSELVAVNLLARHELSPPQFLHGHCSPAGVSFSWNESRKATRKPKGDEQPNFVML